MKTCFVFFVSLLSFSLQAQVLKVDASHVFLRDKIILEHKQTALDAKTNVVELNTLKKEKVAQFTLKNYTTEVLCNAVFPTFGLQYDVYYPANTSLSYILKSLDEANALCDSGLVQSGIEEYCRQHGYRLKKIAP
jgi:hypothetical protein